MSRVNEISILKAAYSGIGSSLSLVVLVTGNDNS